jgi:ABC-type transport system involved in cytochrome c biogenesis permease subunit
MRRIGKLLGGLILTGLVAGGLPVRASETVKSLGTGPAYEVLGAVPVMHEGRVKPLDTVAREEVKQVYSRETIKLRDPREEIEKILKPEVLNRPDVSKWTVEKWGPVSAFIGWTLRPEFWDDQPFILVDYLPLRRLLLAGTVEARLKAIADKPTTPGEEKDRLKKLAVDHELAASALIAFVRGSKLPDEDRKTIAELAAKLTEEHKWLAPRELEEARVTDKGQTLPFMSWASTLSEQQRKFEANPQSVERPTEVERRAVEVAHRLMSYKAYSEDQFRTVGLILIMPRPSDARYLAYTAGAIKEVREQKARTSDLPLMKIDALNAIASYWRNIPSEDHRTPTEDATADRRFAAWLRGSSTWVPLKLLLKSKPEELIEAGYPEGQVKAFLAAYSELAEAEVRNPGQVSQTAASGLLTASRALGEAVNPTGYPNIAMIDRETHFNATNPFGQAPFAYGTALALLAISLGFVSVKTGKSFSGLLGSSIYGLGMLALVVGIAIEIYGFYLRVWITGWAPVTNMYETVIWVALVAAVLALVFELIFRQVYVALAGSAVALLGTITAANVPLLDPRIKSLQPVLRSNLWLTIHVLTEVSSYAAFGLAWALGLIATLYYLTATYRRSPRLAELVLPLVPALPLALVGGAGVAAGYGIFGPEWTTGDALFFMFALMGLLGGMISLATLLALAAEGLERLTSRARTEQGEEAEESSWEAAETATEGSLVASAAGGDDGGGVATLARPTVAEIRARAASNPLKLDARGQAMQRTAATVKPLGNFIYRTMQVGVLLVAAGTILGGVWADYSWGRFWGWDPKEVWALITLLVYLIPLHGRFAGWVSSFGLVVASVVCFLSVMMAWYGVNFVLGVGLHSYGFVEGASQGMMMVIIAGVLALPAAAIWRRYLGYRPIL